MNQKLDILKKIESKEISVEEGLELLEALEQAEYVMDEPGFGTRAGTGIPHKDARDETARTPRDSDDDTAGGRTYKDVDIRLISCRLSIERSNVEEVTAEILHNKTGELINRPDWLEISEEGHVIRIKENRQITFNTIVDVFRGEGDFLTPIYLRLKLPQDMVIGNGLIKNVSGKVTAIGLKAEKLEISVVSGRVDLADLEAQTLHVKGVSDSLTCHDVVSEHCVVSSTSGKIYISGRQRHLELKTVSGKIGLDATDALDVLSASTVSGKIEINAVNPARYTLNFKTLSGRMETGGIGTVDSSSGTGRLLTHGGDHPDKQMTVSTLSGNIYLTENRPE